MRMRKWFIVLLLVFALLLGGCMPAYAVQQALGQLQLSLTTDKAAYGEFEQITATLEIANNSKTDMYDIDIAHQLLNGYKLAPDAKDTLRIAKLGAGETQRSVLTYVHELGEYVDPNGVVNVLPATGDDSAAAVWGVLLLVSLALIVVLGLRYRSVQRVLSLVLCVGCLLSCVTFAPVQAKAEDQDEESGVTLSSDSIALTERVAVGEGHVDVGASVKFSETSLRDSDGDGLQDYIENIVGSSNAKADTDGDGLTDFQEVTELGTDPTKADSDGDGIADGGEDTDGDGIANSVENEMGLDPILKDTDFDGLTDAEELNTYGTDPLKADSDGDGANDGIEVAYGSDPCQEETIFIQTVASEPVSENNPVAVEVIANVSGDLLGTVMVTKADYVNHPFATGNIPGALGSAYEFTAGGDINNAFVTFKYDTSLGTIGDKFQPRIYYVNEETQMLEELPHQWVEDGEVSATLDHFSCYMLINRVEYEAAWDAAIQPRPEYDTVMTGNDVVFVLDTSTYASDYDGMQVRVALMSGFLKGLGENDRVAAVDADRYAEVELGFTSDVEVFRDIAFDFEHRGGFDYDSAMETAIGLFTNAYYTRKNAYKYIILVVADDCRAYNTMYTSLAADNGIVVYTVGFGAVVNEKIMKSIANGTNGRYFSERDYELDEIYDAIRTEIMEKPLDYTADSNDDGISDYYTRMLFEGKLLMGNGSHRYIGEDFNYDVHGNPSDDYDGDGLKNGEELSVEKSGGRVYVRMKSNPLLADSDYDGIDDKTERENHSNPLKYSYDAPSVMALCNDDSFPGYILANHYDSKGSVRAAVSIVDVLAFNWSPVKNCQQVYMDYFYDYAENAVASAAEANEEAATIEWVSTLSENVKDGIKYTLAGKDYGVDEPMKVLQDLYVLRSQLNTINNRISLAQKQPNSSVRIDKLSDDLVEINKKLDGYGLLNKKLSVKVTDFANKYRHLMNKKNFTGMKNSTTITVAAGVLSTGVSVANTVSAYAKLKANETAFAENLDILAYMAENANRPMAKKAANQLYDIIAGEFESFNDARAVAVSQDVATGGMELAVSAFVSLNPYVNAAKLAFDALDLLLGASHKAKSIDNALCLEVLTTSMRKLAQSQLKSTGRTFDCDSAEHEVEDRYLMHLVQSRIVAERNFVDYTKDKGLVTMWFSGGYEQAKEICSRVILQMNLYADKLGVSISDKLSKL